MPASATSSSSSAATSYTSPKAKALVSIEDRLEHGNLSVDEVCALADCSRVTFYADLRAGRVIVKKKGRRTHVPGPIAKRYIAGEPIHTTAPNDDSLAAA